MRIIHVNTHVNVGGIGQYIASLTKALKDRSVECIVASSGGNLEPELKKNGIPHRYLDIKTKFFLSPKVLRAAIMLSNIIREEKIDLIHAHTRVSQAVSDISSRMTGIPYIATCHGFFKPKLSRRLYDTWGKKVIAISQAVETHLERDFNIDEDRIELIYNGVDINRFSEIYTPEYLAKTKKIFDLKEGPVIGTMGRLSPVKGQRYLIEAMKYVISKKKDAHCLIVGSGKEEKSLRELSVSLGVSKNISFTGSAHDIIPLYLAMMDIFVLPSIEEGLGFALLEAMAAGKPCIGSDVGGISEIIQNGINGVKIPAKDAGATADAVLRLLDNRALRERIAANGKSIVKEKFSLDVMADKMAGLYREVASGKK